MKIEIIKSQKIIKFYLQIDQVKEFTIGVGEVEIGRKQLRSDNKTPEGEYKICVKNNKSKFFLSLGLNYPNREDAKAGLSDKIITQDQYYSIIKAHETHGGSDWSTPLGGEIYIHGGLEDKPYSEGCIRMYNKDIELIFDKINIGDTVIIKA